MILISLNLIACSSSGGGGESTPAVDNGDGGDGGGGEPPKKPMTPTDVGGDDETLGESCTPPMSVPQIDSTKDFFYLVKYLGGGTGANAPRTNGAKIVFSAYRKNNTGLVTSDVSFEVIGNPNYTETLTFADSEHFASVVVTIGVNPPSSIVIYPLDGGATYPVGLTSGNPYFTSSTSNCTDANDYFEFNSGSDADQRCFTPDTIPDVTPAGSESFRAFTAKALEDALKDVSNPVDAVICL